MVGAGPSGATLGYYLGKMGRKVLLLEKKTFPRDKYCGDAVCKIAIEILHEMGLYEQLLRENKAYVVCRLFCFLAHPIVNVPLELIYLYYYVLKVCPWVTAKPHCLTIS